MSGHRARCQRPYPVRACAVRAVLHRDLVHVVLFDMMDTLIEDPFYLAVRHLMDEDARARWTAARNPAAFLRFEAGLCTESEYFRSFFRDGRTPEGLPSPARLKKRMMRDVHWLPGVVEVLRRLGAVRETKADVRLGLASNYSYWYRDIFRSRRDLPGFFDLFFFSCEVGHRKPSMPFFTIVDQSLRAAGASSVLFFDDREENLRIPRELGWSAVHVDEKQRASSVIEEALVSRGLIPDVGGTTPL